MTIYHTRPFNTEYVIWQPSKHSPEAARRSHRTAKVNYWYINRTWGIDDV